MSQVTLSLSSDSDDLVERVTASFDDEEIQVFLRFVAAMERIRASGLVKRGVPSITNISFVAGQGTQFTCAPYEDAELYELLHVLRPVILSQEASSFEKVTGLLGKRFANENFRAQLKTLRTVFVDGELKLYMQISLNGRPLFDDSTLKLWLNGAEYHQDVAKAEQWSAFAHSLTESNTRAFVITQLQSKIKALLGLQHIVQLVLQKDVSNQPA